MKKRKPILGFQNSQGVPTRSEAQPLVCYSEDSDTESNITISTTTASQNADDRSNKPTTPWQVCVDENSGYTYYWNMNSNQVTWEPPADYRVYQNLLQQWKTRQTANTTQFQEHVETPSEKDHSSSDSDSSVKEGKIELITTYGSPSDDSGQENSEKNDKQNFKSETRDFVFNSKDKSMAPDPKPTTIISSLSEYLDTSEISNEDSIDNSSPEKKLDNSSETGKNFNFLKEGLTNIKSTSGVGMKDAETPLVKTIKTKSLADDKESKSKNSDEDNSDDEEEMDDVIVNRLRSKATLLQQLGGEVPKELMSVFDDTKSAEDIIAEIEKEIPADQSEKSFNPSPAESIPNTEKPPESGASKPLFPIMDYMKKEEFTDFKTPKVPISKNKSTKNIKKIKLSARAKELIHASLLTAKARATNFIETEDGLKPVEEVKKVGKESSLQGKDENADSTDSEKKKTIKESDKKPPNYFNLIDDGASDEKKSITFSHQSEESSGSKSVPKFTKSEGDKSSDEKYNFQKSFMVYYPKDKKNEESSKKNEDLKNTSLWSKCEEFLKSEVKRSGDGPKGRECDKGDKRFDGKKNEKSLNKEKIFNDIDIDEVLNTKSDNEEKKTIDLSQLIMEKLKFLNDNKSSVAPVQVMAIQIETLVAAWQAGALTLKYLSEWLSASTTQLKSIEEAAAPSGWHCEWDRSYGRYYYRNKVTGSIQWDFPDYDGKSRSSSRRSSSRRSSSSRSRRPRTPPPPVISDRVSPLPPPPPVISDYDRKRKSSPRRSSYYSSDRRRRSSSDRYERSRHSSSKSRRYSPPSHALPPLPAVPPKPDTPPPPPPPSSPPPQPPPPPVISPSEFGPKNTFADECTTVTPMEIENDLEDKPIKTAVLHDELHSFYSDIASIEANFTGGKSEPIGGKVENVSKPQTVVKMTNNIEKPKIEEKVKKKKKVKLDSGLSLKKKGIEGLVAKWQKVNSDI